MSNYTPLNTKEFVRKHFPHAGSVSAKHGYHPGKLDIVLIAVGLLTLIVLGVLSYMLYIKNFA
jgi:hypothetical protein